MNGRRCLLGLCAVLFTTVAAGADLPLGETFPGRTKGGRPASYEFTAEGAGVLMVVVRADSDVIVNVVNSSGRPIENGRIDSDYLGDSGAEQGAIVLGQPGKYEVRVEPFGADTVQFVMGASWLPMDAVAREPDPHGSPEDAIAMEVGKNYEEVIDGSKGDLQAWYRVEAKSDGLLNVATRTESGDVVLECYKKDEFEFAVERSDQDIGGDSGRESIAVDVKEGDVYYFVVSAFSGAADYSIRAVLTDN
jgi:hypothetical protein